MKEPAAGRYRFDDFELDIQNLRLTVGLEVCPLEPKSFRVLQFLVENRHRAVSKEEIVSAVWPGTFVSDNSITRAVAQIRKALADDAKEPKYIETVPTVGYRFVGKCLETQDAPAVFDGTVAIDGPPVASLDDREAVPERMSGTFPSGRPGGRLAGKSWLAIGVTAALLLGVGVWWTVASRSSSDPRLLQVTSVSKLTSYPGDEREPAISPDGSYVAFSWSGESGDNYDIYLVQTGGQQPLRLTRDPAPDSFPAWSPDGRQIAFIRHQGAAAEIIVIPPLGGAERILHQFPRIGADLDFSQHPVLTWSQDGKSIIYSGQAGAGERFRLFILSVETGEVRAISSPEKEFIGDSSPALSADGRSLAFVRYLAPLNGRVLIQPLGPGMTPGGALTDVTKSGLALRSPVWLDDGKRLLFADATRIFQWERKKEPVPIYVANGFLGGLSLGPKRSDNSWQAVVASENHDFHIWIIPLNADGTKSTGPPQVLLRSTADDTHPEYSPDGRHIAFCSNRSGSAELWLSDADGGNPRQLTHLGAHVLSYPKWSPDGSRIVFHARVPDVAEVYVVDADRGVPRQITHENPGLAVATWSGDGKFIYASTLVGRAVTYRFPAEGGPMQRLWDGDLVLESADRKYALYSKSNAPGIFRRSLQGDLSKNPEELLVADFSRTGQLGGYAAVARGIYYVSADEQGRPGPFRYFEYATRKSIEVAPAVSGLGKGFAVSPDRRRMVFEATAEVGGDLLSLELR